MKKKILFIVTEDWYFLSHRLKLAKFLSKKGFEIFVCCKDTGRAEEIEKNGICYFSLDTDRKSLSIFKLFKESISIIKIAKNIRPEVIHLISMRSIITGTFAAFFVKSRFCATFTGMGFLFIKKNVKISFLRNIIINYLKAFLKFKVLFFIVQNRDDKAFFKKMFNLNKTMLRIIRGSGVDINYFKYFPEINKEKVRLAYAGRILEDKGIFWLVEAYKKAKAKFENLELYIAGSLDEKNPSSIQKDQFKKLIDFKDIYYVGNIRNIKKFWQHADIAILLSKREGLPLSLMEAAAIGRPIISTDVTGSREIAINNYNSVNIKIENIQACSKAILKLAKNKMLRKKYGKNSRKLVEGDMAITQVNYKYYSLYNDIIKLEKR